MRCNRRPTSAGPSLRTRFSRTAAFTLVELLVCLAVVGLLTALLMPALRMVRETSQRLRCASNMHQIGAAIATYAQLHNDNLPYSYHADPQHRLPQELMAATRGPSSPFWPNAPVWEGLGWLMHGSYLSTCHCLYCPSHRGEHSVERAASGFQSPTEIRVYTNYHYSGHISQDGRRLNFDMGRDLLLLTDGLRTQSDFNHGSGTNRLFGDLSTDWWYDADHTLRNMLPNSVVTPDGQAATFDHVWEELQTTEP